MISERNEERKEPDLESVSELLKENRVKARISAVNFSNVQEMTENLGIKIQENSSNDVICNELGKECYMNVKAYDYLMEQSILTRCKYDYICVMDFEATCIGRRSYGGFFPHEIIEFPAYLISVKEIDVVSHFHSFVKPVIHPQLTEFCTSLTGITQETINEAPGFEQVFDAFQKWISSFNKNNESFIICTDGPRDILDFLCLTCLVHNKAIPEWTKNFIDIRSVYKKNYKHLKSTVSLQELLHNVGLSFEGRKHSGIDDARNLSKLVCMMLKDGVQLGMTNHVFPDKLHFLKKRLMSYLEQNVPPSNPARLMVIKTLKDIKGL